MIHSRFVCWHSVKQFCILLGGDIMTHSRMFWTYMQTKKYTTNKQANDNAAGGCYFPSKKKLNSVRWQEQFSNFSYLQSELSDWSKKIRKLNKLENSKNLKAFFFGQDNVCRLLSYTIGITHKMMQRLFPCRVTLQLSQAARCGDPASNEILLGEESTRAWWLLGAYPAASQKFHETK